MTRWGGILAAMLLSVTGHAPPDPVPNAVPPGFTPAPVPNQDITTPLRIGDGSPTLSGRLQQPRTLLRSGDGFTPGSNFSEDLERRSRGTGVGTGFAPTVSINVPLR
jgi:hypothetical protein